MPSTNRLPKHVFAIFNVQGMNDFVALMILMFSVLNPPYPKVKTLECLKELGVIDRDVPPVGSCSGSLEVLPLKGLRLYCWL